MWISELLQKAEAGWCFSVASLSDSPIRTTPLISPPSCTSNRRVVMSPCTTLVAWSSTRSCPCTLPRTSPPTIASRVTMSPSTSPPFATSTWRPARIVPTTTPSTFTTPSAVMSPTPRIPVPMIESPASAPSPPPRGFSVNIAMSVPLLHERERVQRAPVAPNFEMEMRRRGPAGVPGQRDDLPCGHILPFAHQQPGGVAIHRFIPPRVPQEHEQPVVRVRPRRRDAPSPGRPDGRATRNRNVDPRVRLRRRTGADLASRDEPPHVERPMHRERGARRITLRGAGFARPDRRRAHQVHGDHVLPATSRSRRASTEDLPKLLVVGFRTVERGRQLLHPAVLRLEPRDLSPKPVVIDRPPGDWSREGKEQEHQHGDDPRRPFPHTKSPERQPVLPGIEVAVGVHDDRDAAPFHPSKGAPSISSSTPFSSSPLSMAWTSSGSLAAFSARSMIALMTGWKWR